MYAVVTMSEHDTQADLFYTHVTVGTLGALLHLGLISLSFFLISYFFVAASEEFRERDSVPSVFKGQQEFIILGLNFTRL